jgi:hypothetical protein
MRKRKLFIQNEKKKKQKKTIHKKNQSFIDVYIYNSQFYAGIVNVIVGCCNAGVLPNGLLFGPTLPS